MVPDNVSVPLPLTVSAPEPEMTPEKVPAPAVSVSVSVPRVTPPAPDSVLIEAPAVVAEISKVPASATPLDVAIEPEPDSASVPAVIVVAPL